MGPPLAPPRHSLSRSLSFSLSFFVSSFSLSLRLSSVYMPQPVSAMVKLSISCHYLLFSLSFFLSVSLCLYFSSRCLSFSEFWFGSGCFSSQTSELHTVVQTVGLTIVRKAPCCFMFLLFNVLLDLSVFYSYYYSFSILFSSLRNG